MLGFFSSSAILKNSALKTKLHICIIIIIIILVFSEKKDFRISYVSDHPSFCILLLRGWYTLTYHKSSD